MFRLTYLSGNNYRKVFSFFNFPIFEFHRKNLNEKREFSLCGSLPKRNITSDDVFYLKINTDRPYAYKCLSHWINIVQEYGADFYIVCDSLVLKYKILKNVPFHSLDVKFIKSIKNKNTKRITKFFCDKWWHKCSYAHLTSFFHARKIKAPFFWNIDADDTMILARPATASNMLKSAKKYAIENSLDAFSIDMATSYTYGRHWTFGVTLVNNSSDWQEKFEQAKKTWKGYYNFSETMNIDWVMTSMRDNGISNNKTFYAENMNFFHFGDFFITLHDLLIFKKGKVKYNIFNKFFDNKLGIFPIYRDSVCVSSFSENESELAKNDILWHKLYENIIKSGLALDPGK